MMRIYCISESFGILFITASIIITITTRTYHVYVHGLSYPPIHRRIQHIRHQNRLKSIQGFSSPHHHKISHRHFPISSLFAVSGFNDDEDDMEDSSSRSGQRKLLEQMKNKELIQKLLMIPSLQSSSISSTATTDGSTTFTSSGYSSDGGLVELNLLGQGSASVVTIREDARRDDTSDISQKDASMLPCLFLSPSYYCQQMQKEILLRQMKQTLSSTSLSLFHHCPYPYQTRNKSNSSYRLLARTRPVRSR